MAKISERDRIVFDQMEIVDKLFKLPINIPVKLIGAHQRNEVLKHLIKLETESRKEKSIVDHFAAIMVTGPANDRVKEREV